MKRIPVLGTRGSRLALVQARRVAELLGGTTRLRTIRTTGDRVKEELAPGGSDIGFFTREIEARLLEREVDIAVHSLKDLPTVPPAGLRLAAVLERDFVTDVIITTPRFVAGGEIPAIAPGARIGTSSLRRRALQAVFLPGTTAVPMRGNVDTRIRKLREGICDALLLSRAGVERLALRFDDLVVLEISPLLWLPSPGQGVIAVEVREGDPEMIELCSGINHPPTMSATSIEREVMRLAGGGCHAPFGAYARPAAGGTWSVHAGTVDESGRWRSVDATGEAGSLPAAALALLRESREPGRPDGGPLLRRLA